VEDIFLPHFGLCNRLNAYLSIVSDHVHHFMTIVSPSSDGYFQQDNAPCHKDQIISNGFLEHDNKFSIIKWPLQSPDLNIIDKAPLGCGGTGDSHHRCADDKS